MRIFTVLFACFLFTSAFAQNKTATVSGKVVDENDQPLSGVSIIILGKNTGISTSDSGKFSISVPSSRAFALVFSYTGFFPVQKNFLLNAAEIENIYIRLSRDKKMLQSVTVTDDKIRRENGLIRINPKNALILPSTTGGVEGLIKVLVGSNNELSSQYNVRGGNYDENSIYINDFEVYRPYLVSNGQQEGLSFINPELARNVNFFVGGFQAQYGDRMSSVLDIQYKKPSQFAGSVYAGLLEQGAHLEGTLAKQKVTYLIGARNRNNRNLLSNQPTVGAYQPSSSDVQTYISYKLNQKWQCEFLGILSSSSFNYQPESVKKTSSVFSPFYTSNLGLDIFFEGQEKDTYKTSLAGLTLIHSVSKKLKLKWMISAFRDKEKESYDIAAAYLFGDRDFDDNSSTFGQIINPLGQGYYQNYARNLLNIQVWNASHKGSYEAGKHFLQWGNSIEQTKIDDRLKEWEYRDSAGYSTPYTPGNLSLFSSLNSKTNLTVNKFQGYIQDNIRLLKGKNEFTIQGGIRYNYNSLNKELLISPRIQASIKPDWKADVIFKVAAGMYQQPPFYRELRDIKGNINTGILAQKSIQFIAGMDYSFKGPGERPFRFTTEAYFKSMNDVVPYDIDNVKIRYLGANSAKAYATGVEFRLFGELVSDAESWISLSFMRTKENLNNDFYYNYLNAAGEIINAQTTDKNITDSAQMSVGYVRRPSDRFITAGLFLQDYLSTNKNFKVHLNMLYGSNMSYNIPNSTRYRNALIIDPYIRVDLGFSILLLKEKSLRRSHAPFKALDNAWISLEVFNLIDRENTISYQLVKDFSGTSFAIPNRLTPRLINLKLVTRFSSR